jgi:hypothetical protein
MYYTLDKNDVIKEVSHDWQAFYEGETDTEVQVTPFLGKSIWNFILGPDTKEIYRDVFKMVRHTGKGLEFPFFCNSPKARRRFKMKISPVYGQEIKVETLLLRETALNRDVYFKTRAISGPKVYFRCSNCNDIKVDMRWFDVERALSEGLLDEPNRELHVAYTFCEICRQNLRKKMEELRA